MTTQTVTMTQTVANISADANGVVTAYKEAQNGTPTA